MPRFVLLRHQCPPGYEKPSHWDFMLEADGGLRTWELRELPSAWAALLGETSGSFVVKATPLPDHRLAYLDFEGPLSGDRGSVHRCDGGTYELLQQPTEQRIEIRLNGSLLREKVSLICQGQAWTLAFEKH